LRAVEIERVVDVRAQPGSRRHPHFARDAMERWLPERGLAYRWEPRLGGRRTPRPDSPHTAITEPQFRGYADQMETPDFARALDAVLADADERATSVVCAESVWWRCHRRFIADAAVLLRGATVLHIFHDGRVTEHRPMPEARVATTRLVYDGGAARLPGTGDE
jgi:uncharacterized protein (DUF488 family)